MWFHSKFLFTNFLLLGLFAAGFLHHLPYMLLASIASFRFSSTSVLKTVCGGQWDHFDTGLGIWMLAIAPILYFGEEGMLDKSAYVMCTYMLVQNMYVLFKDLSALEK